jgi:hypothetical protein
MASIGSLLTNKRVPVTDECAPDSDDFEKITSIMKEGFHGSAFVFNCQMGRGKWLCFLSTDLL